nr:TPA_asm: hypothetical protein [Opistofel virus]
MRNPFVRGKAASLPSALPRNLKRTPVRRWISDMKVRLLPGVYNHEDPAIWSQMIESKRLVSTDLRKNFLKWFKLPVREAPTKHSHPDACLRRNVANAGMVAAIEALKLKPYNVSKSSSDRTKGNRHYYVPKDLKLPFADDVVEDNSCYMMVDVDYYVDLPQYLRTFRPVMIYTFVPPAIAGNHGEHRWWFDGDEVVHEVSGGASYKHRLWDHCHDSVEVVDRYGNLLVYEVVQIELPDDPLHRVILYAPQSATKGPYWHRLKIHGLERLVVRHGDAAILRVPSKGKYSIALSGTMASVELEDKYLLGAQLRYQEMRNPTIGELQRYLQTHVSDPDSSVPIIWSLLKTGFTIADVRRVPDVYVYQPGSKPISFVALEPHTSMEEGKEHGMVIGPPLVVEEAVVPRSAYANQVRTVRERVTKIANTAKPPALMAQLAREFILRTVPEEGAGFPVSYDEVFENQSRPSQVARTNLTFGTLGAQGDRVTVNAFQKKESYGEAKAARNISQVPTDHTLRLSCFTYAMKRVLKQHSWYGAANNPTQTIERLRDIAGRSKDGVVCKDYSRFDGTISKWLYLHIARASVERWVATEHRDEVLAMLDAENNATARTESGIKYSTGFSRLSGSPVTSDHNTIINAFISYAALRSKMSADAAWAALGIYCGDDAVDIAPIAKDIGRVSNMFGLKVKIAKHQYGQPVDYCGRWFVDIWNAVDSFADPIRTMRKLHISFSDQPLETARANRAAGYLVTDALTPIIGSYCRKMQMAPVVVDRMTKEEHLRYSNAWPQENAAGILDAFLAVTGLTLAEVETTEELITAAKTIDGVPPRLLSFPTEHEQGTLVGEEIIPRARVSMDILPSVTEEDGRNEATSSEATTTTTTTASVDNNTAPPEEQAGPSPATGNGPANTTDTGTQTGSRATRHRRRRHRPPRVLVNAERENIDCPNVTEVQPREIGDVHARQNGHRVQRLRRNVGDGGSSGYRRHVGDFGPQVVPRLQTRRSPRGRSNNNAACPQLLTSGLAVDEQHAVKATPDASIDVRNKYNGGRGGQRRFPPSRSPYGDH